MARPNVTVLINDESFVIPGAESGGLFRAGFLTTNDLIKNVGITSDRTNGIMSVSSLNEWFGTLSSQAPLGDGITGDGNYHSSNDPEGNVTGGTGMERWPNGPSSHAWAGEWWTIHNYLQYGGVAVIGADSTDLTNKQVSLDAVVCMASGEVALTSAGVTIGQSFYSDSTDITGADGIVQGRLDCVGVFPYTGGTAAYYSVDATPSVAGTNNEYTIAVAGAKRFLGISKNSESDILEMNCAPDVAGCLVRTDRDSELWFSPAGFKRGNILDVVRLTYNPTEAEQDTLYNANINPVVTYPGEGTVLFGDKTTAASTSSLGRINVSRLFIYLKKVVGSAARSLLFEMNDEDARTAFVNAVEPLLERIKGRRGVYDYKVICDESNNTADIVDSNQFVADVLIKPSKSINFIKITFTSANTAVDLT